jgi:hypothetical protein
MARSPHAVAPHWAVVTAATASTMTATAAPERRATLTGLIAGLGTFAFLLLGINRSYDLDESLTVGLFVATPDLGDAFTEAYVLNNHVLLSFLDHLVYTVTGSHGEPAMRTLPVLFAAGAVGLLAFLLARRLGVLAAAAGALVLATNPTFADVGSQVRGYSLVVLLTIATTTLLLEALADGDATVERRVTYAILAALGVATHLYMLVVVGVHVVLATTRRKVWQAWVPAWLAAALGLAAYMFLWRDMRATAEAVGRRFRGGFPVDLGGALLGGSIVAAVLLLVVVGPVVWRARRAAIVRLGALGIAGAVIAVWLVAPFDLYPRFFLWLAPLPAVGVAIAVASRRAVALVVVPIVVAQLWVAWPRLTEDPYASRTARDVFARVTATGERPCALDAFTSIRLTAYTTRFEVPTEQPGLELCAVVVMLGAAEEPRPRSVRDADESFPHRTTLNARHDATLWSRAPTECWLSDAPPASCAPAAP